MRLDLFTAWLARCLADFGQQHEDPEEERDPLEWLGLLFADASGLPNPVAVERTSPLLMVTVSTRPGVLDSDEDAEEEPGYCLGLRFCYPDDVARIERLLVAQVRRRYPTYAGLKPGEVRKLLVFTVWEVPTPPKRGGWPKWLGPTGYYK